MESNFLDHLRPIEEGAWVLLLVPLVVGTLAGPMRFFEPALLLISALGIFLARRPVLHWLHAFSRQSPSHFQLIWPGKEVLLCMVLFLAGGVPLLMMGRVLLLVVFGMAVLLIWSELFLDFWRQEHLLFTQLTEVLVLCLLAPSAYYVAVGRLDKIAFTLWALCVVYFAVTVLDLRLRITQLQVAHGLAEKYVIGIRRQNLWVTVWLSGGLLFLLVRHTWIHPIALVAFSPLLIRPLWPPALHPSRPWSIRSLGWREMGYALTFTLCASLLV